MSGIYSKNLKNKSGILIVFFAIMAVVCILGFYRLAAGSQAAIQILTYDEYVELTKDTKDAIGVILDCKGEILWSHDFRGFDDSYNLVGELRTKPLTENVVAEKEKGYLTGSENYSFFIGAESLAGSKMDVQLTLDHTLNQYIYELMNAMGIGNGSVLLMNASNGEIISAVSVPSKVPESMDLEDGTLINKNLRTTIPGSTMKIITSLLLLDNPNFVKEETVQCSGQTELAAGGAVTCVTKRGEKNLISGLGTSCNVYYATQINRYLDADKEATREKLQGLGILQEAAEGKVDNLNKKNSYISYDGSGSFESTWSLIGEGNVQMNPIDFAKIVAGIVHEGAMPEPHIVQRLYDAEGNLVEKHNCKTQQMPFSSAESTYGIWKEAYQTYYAKENYGSQVTVAKTGTAEYDNGKVRTTGKLLVGYMEESDLVFFIEVRDYSESKVMPAELIRGISDYLTTI